MPTYDTSGNYGLRALTGTNVGSDIDAGFAALRDDVKAIIVGYSAGPLGSRPTSTVGSPGIAGRRYRATDTGQLFEDTGTSWEQIYNGSHGKSIIAASESRTNTAYGTLATPDQVSIVMPADGLLAIGYSARMQNSAADAGRAAIFLGASQLKVPDSENGALNVSEAVGPSTTGRFGWLSSFGAGLACGNAGAAMPVPLTTGMAVAVVGSGSATFSAASAGRFNVGGNYATGAVNAGMCFVFAAAGTYTVSVQFKSASGSVTVDNRKLWAWALGF